MGRYSFGVTNNRGSSNAGAAKDENSARLPRAHPGKDAEISPGVPDDVEGQRSIAQGDAVGLYLRGLSDVPLLSHEQEISLGTTMRWAARKALRTIMASDFVAERCLTLLGDIQRKSARLDRVIDVGPADAETKLIIRSRLEPNTKTIAGIIARNRQHFSKRLSRSTDSVDKDNAAHSQEYGRRHVASLLSEARGRTRVARACTTLGGRRTCTGVLSGLPLRLAACLRLTHSRLRRPRRVPARVPRVCTRVSC